MTIKFEKLQMKYLGFRINDDWRYSEDYGTSLSMDNEILAGFMEINEKIIVLRKKCYDRASTDADYNMDFVLLLDDLAPYLESAIEFLQV